MSTLLLQSCSASKQEVREPAPAFDVYSGYFYKILKKAIRDGEFRADMDIAILSAKYGLVDRDEEIEYYDQRMDPARAEEVNSSVVNAATGRIREGEYDCVVINMGKPYQKALAGLSAQVDTPIGEIAGDGIGEKGNALYRFIRGEDAVVSAVADL